MDESAFASGDGIHPRARGTGRKPFPGIILIGLRCFGLKFKLSDATLTRLVNHL